MTKRPEDESEHLPPENGDDAEERDEGDAVPEPVGPPEPAK